MAAVSGCVSRGAGGGRGTGPCGTREGGAGGSVSPCPWALCCQEGQPPPSSLLLPGTPRGCVTPGGSSPRSLLCLLQARSAASASPRLTAAVPRTRPVPSPWRDTHTHTSMHFVRCSQGPRPPPQHFPPLLGLHGPPLLPPFPSVPVSPGAGGVGSAPPSPHPLLLYHPQTKSNRSGFWCHFDRTIKTSLVGSGAPWLFSDTPPAPWTSPGRGGPPVGPVVWGLPPGGALCPQLGLAVPPRPVGARGTRGCCLARRGHKRPPRGAPHSPGAGTGAACAAVAVLPPAAPCRAHAGAHPPTPPGSCPCFSPRRCAPCVPAAPPDPSAEAALRTRADPRACGGAHVCVHASAHVCKPRAPNSAVLPPPAHPPAGGPPSPKGQQGPLPPWPQTPRHAERPDLPVARCRHRHGCGCGAMLRLSRGGRGIPIPTPQTTKGEVVPHVPPAMVFSCVSLSPRFSAGSVSRAATVAAFWACTPQAGDPEAAAPPQSLTGSGRPRGRDGVRSCCFPGRM